MASEKWRIKPEPPGKFIGVNQLISFDINIRLDDDINMIPLKLKEFTKKILGRYYIPAKHYFNFLHWLLPFLVRVPSIGGQNSRRILIVYDLASQAFAIGDILIFQEASLVLRRLHDVDFIDFALVYNSEEPIMAPVYKSLINKTSIHSHLNNIIPVLHVNPYIGSVFIFNSHDSIYKFLLDNMQNYFVWPSAKLFGSKDYLYYKIFNEILWDYFYSMGDIPSLSVRSHTLIWANEFISRHVYPSVPVTIQIRNNRLFAQHRNLDLVPWINFFADANKKYKVIFIIICALSEVDDRLRKCPNVIIAKDYHTGVDQDLALIQAAAIHMGAASGPGSMALFSRKPFLLVNHDLVFSWYKGLIFDGIKVRFFFSSEFQNFLNVPVTESILIDEFARMYYSLSKLEL